ncbi:MAG: hypothetical protein II855_01355 [Candidatus Methanomethylophilaceae archaeon]|nr:hypothetical protein [Candidatus Methanomethylophilaceae archaeon]
MEYEEYVVDLNADCKCGCMDAGRFHKIFHFPNDWGASVVDNPKIAGYSKEGYRVMILRFSDAENYRIVRDLMFENDEIECKDWATAVKTLTKIKNLK